MNFARRGQQSSTQNNRQSSHIDAHETTSAAFAAQPQSHRKNVSAWSIGHDDPTASSFSSSPASRSVQSAVKNASRIDARDPAPVPESRTRRARPGYGEHSPFEETRRGGSTARPSTTRAQVHYQRTLPWCSASRDEQTMRPPTKKLIQSNLKSKLTCSLSAAVGVIRGDTHSTSSALHLGTVPIYGVHVPNMMCRKVVHT